MRVFFDVDDTLILWEDEVRESGVIVRERWKPNLPLFAAMMIFEAHGYPDNPLVWLWSNEPDSQQAAWAFRHGLGEGCVAKDPSLPEPGDVVVDDTAGFCDVHTHDAHYYIDVGALAEGVIAMTPEEFIAMVLEESRE